MGTGSFARGLIGLILDGRYRLDALLGEGGMGAVFRAQHLATERNVAVKLLKPHLIQDDSAAQRFLREARATLKVDSPHAVKVLDFGITPHRDYYMALEYLDGRTVQRELDVDGPFAPARVRHVARQALDALAAAHEIGLVHRDIKPDNILLMKVGSDPDYAKLLDFGVAKLMEGAAVDAANLALTQAGMVFGTPEFMSPEQAMGQRLDGRSDLYSLAATMFVMLTGSPLFEAKTPIELLTHHVRTPPPHLDSLVPELAQYPRLDALLQRTLAKRKEERPATADEFAHLLAQLDNSVQHGGMAVRARRSRSPSRSVSAYFHALPADADSSPSRASHSTLTPLVSAQAPGTRDDDLDVLDQPPPRHRMLLVAAGMGIAAIVAVIVVATRAHPPAAARIAAPPDAMLVAQVGHITDAAVVVASDAPPSDAAVRVKPGASHRTAVNPPTRDAHLKAAEEALREGNQLRQLAEADLALRADRRSTRAKYLLADALIKAGDLDRGCSYLKALGRYPLAIARSNTAACPSRSASPAD